MRHSSRLLRIFAVALIIPTTAGAAGFAARGPSVGSARGLSPVRPVVGLARGLSPVRPVVGSARPLSPRAFGAEGRRRIGPRHPFRERNIAGGYADFGFPGFGFYGGQVGDGAGSYDRPAEGPPAAFDGYPHVLLAPPLPCVHPQIIRIGRSVHVERQATTRRAVRVIYGRPPCGAY